MAKGRDSKGKFVAGSSEAKEQGSKGGKNAKKPKGFAANPELAKIAGQKGRENRKNGA